MAGFNREIRPRTFYDFRVGFLQTTLNNTLFTRAGFSICSLLERAEWKKGESNFVQSFYSNEMFSPHSRFVTELQLVSSETRKICKTARMRNVICCLSVCTFVFLFLDENVFTDFFYYRLIYNTLSVKQYTV